MGKAEVVLIDTSSWIEALRADGNIDVRRRVQTLMIDGRAAWCDLVAVDLFLLSLPGRHGPERTAGAGLRRGSHQPSAGCGGGRPARRSVGF